MYDIQLFNGTQKKGDLIIFFSKYSTLPLRVVPPVKIMPGPCFHEHGIACGTTCDKVPMAKMITMKDLIIITHSYRFFLMKNGMQLQLPLKLPLCKQCKQNKSRHFSVNIKLRKCTDIRAPIKRRQYFHGLFTYKGTTVCSI